ncbi:hypothetical protein VNI00_014391 [Paramarasmius palmivorus]|uniref:DUF300-domain-containing protein n=1 Tax=Paramarasmius palmivorus TaxID=297713 RepID=A0AAW0BRJ8_9AGAR
MASNLVWQTHHIGWIIASAFTFISCAVSFWLIYKHLKWYTNKREQRRKAFNLHSIHPLISTPDIVRILFMVPIYAVVSLASYFWWNHATPLILLRDCYESTVLTSFFYLLLIYLSPDPDEQRALFQKVGLSKEADNEALRKGEEVKKWVFPLGFVKWKPSTGLSFLQVMKWGVLQYCVLRPATTLAAVVLDYIGLYCEASWSPGWGHIYLVLIVSLSVTIAMYCLIQLYVSASTYLAPQKPLLKLFAIKAVVFLTFWQATFLSVLSMFGIVKDTKYMTAEDINIGIGALLETFEMMLFAFLHVYAFTYKVYKPIHNSKDLPSLPMGKWRALGHAMDFRETFRELWAGTKYMWAKMRGREPKVDISARRQAYYEDAFGRARPSAFAPARPDTRNVSARNKEGTFPADVEELTFPSVRVDVESERIVEVGGRRDWLGAGNHYGYGIYREKSEGLEEQIEQELARRGYGVGKEDYDLGRGHIKPPAEETGHRHNRSWWRSIYNRISQSTDHEQDTRLSPPPSRTASRSKSRKESSRHRNSKRISAEREAESELLSDYRGVIDDPPPASILRKYRASSSRPSHRINTTDDDVLAPLSVYNDHQTSQIQKHQLRHSPRGAMAHLSTSPPSSPPPTSLLLTPQHDGSRDSLLGRVFPSRTDLSNAHTDISNATAPFPPSSENGREIGVAGERQIYHSQVPIPLMTEVVDMPFNHLMSRNIHQSSGAGGLDLERPPRVPVPKRSPTRSPGWNNTQQMPQSPGRSASRGLQRSSAQKYSREQSSRMNRQSLPVQPQQRPYVPPFANRRRSTPMVLTVPAPLAPQAVTPSGLMPSRQYSQDNMDSTLSQPSYSGTLDAVKYPNPSAPTPNDMRASYYSRYPGMPSGSPPISPTRSGSSIAQYTNHHFPSSVSVASRSPPTPDQYSPPGRALPNVPS